MDAYKDNVLDNVSEGSRIFYVSRGKKSGGALHFSRKSVMIYQLPAALRLAAPVIGLEFAHDVSTCLL